MNSQDKPEAAQREPGIGECKNEYEDVALEKKRYDALFQSVLCGIVQYRIDEDGMTVFKKANREAIRIFGYQPAEFWKKKVWDVREVVAKEDRKRVLEEISKLRKEGDKTFYEYRVLQKDGGHCWIIGTAEIIRDIDDEIIVQSVYLDENKRKRTEEKNHILERQVEAGNELLKLALEHTSIYEFYYVPMERKGYLPERTSAAYGNCDTIYEEMGVRFAKDFLARECREEYAAMYEKIHRGEKTATGEFKGKDGKTWHRITLSTVRYSEEGKPVFTTGIDEDITKEKEMEKQLFDARTLDSLTGLYKKEAGIKRVQQHMENKSPQQVCAIMLLDMDDFTKINCEQGGAFADAILQEVADILRNETGEEDILIRLGGDEFMLYVKDCNKARATILGPGIAEKVGGLLFGEKENVRVSVSIGMCVTAVVDEYSGLYRCAESTLQYVKEHGKAAAACYLDTSNELGTMLTKLYPDSVLINEIDNSGEFTNGDIISFTLELLGKAKNLGDAVNLLLMRVGKQFALKRILIFEASYEYQTLACSYQWTKDPADSFPVHMLYFEKGGLQKLADLYNEEGLSEQKEEKDKKLFPSMLHAAFWEEGRYAGAMCFEMEDAGYLWTKEQKKVLKELAKLISSFIMKVRADAISQAKTDFLSRMSHEIRTPMNAIMGMTAIAKTVLEDREKALDCLNKIEKSNAYLLQLINDVLDMSRIENGKVELNYENIDLHELLKNLENMMQQQAAAKNIRFTVKDGYMKNRWLSADSLRLNQILVNIIGNAVKFTQQNGEIIFSVEEVDAFDDQVTLRFSIQDDGIGISKERLAHIFNAFEQADKSIVSQYGGTGLGLSISSRLVQLMGGCLKVKSELDKGSKFYFTLSFIYGEGTTRQDLGEERLAEEVLDFSGRRMLIAEDNELNREIAVTIFSMNGFQTEEAVDGQEAVDMFLSNPPGYYDVILMDIQMPRMDGLQATREIRVSEKKDARIIPIVAMSANAFDADTRKSMDSGMNGHLSKPVEVEKAIRMLADCIREYDLVK